MQVGKREAQPLWEPSHPGVLIVALPAHEILNQGPVLVDFSQAYPAADTAESSLSNTEGHLGNASACKTPQPLPRFPSRRKKNLHP